MITQETLTISSKGRGQTDLTEQITKLVDRSNVTRGLCNVYVQHTSASLMITENYDPKVLEDLEYFISHLVKDGDKHFTHTLEGPDDMAAHIRTVLTETSLTIPITQSRLALGTWQAIYLWEHRYHAHQRQILITLTGE